MLADRISVIFNLLQCSTAEIARFAGCSPSNISRLKNGSRTVAPESRTAKRLAEGIYLYAEQEHLLETIGELCGAKDLQADAMIPALIGWLFEEGEVRLPKAAMPESRKQEEQLRKNFGERLDHIMKLTEFSNVKLASQMNVDSSLISRYRAGIYYPKKNMHIRMRLAELLYTRAQKTNCLEQMAGICAVPTEKLNPELLSEWLFETKTVAPPGIAERILHSIHSLSLSGATAFQNISGFEETEEESFRKTETEDRYWGSEGLRTAVLRFLENVAKTGGELLLYSDEPMDWLTGNPEFFRQWAALMRACVQKRVPVRIIHNIDRNIDEMIPAITGWLPIYMTGMIEPYVFKRIRNARFQHTLFLQPEGAAIYGVSPAGAGEARWYDYIRDEKRLHALEGSFREMLQGASPLLKTYPAPKSEEVLQFYRSRTGSNTSVLLGPSMETMPESLFQKMLRRHNFSKEARRRLMENFRATAQHFSETLQNGHLHELISLPSKDALKQGTVCVNFSAEMMDESLVYTLAEYAEHLTAIRHLLHEKSNYQLTLLPEPPFKDIQILTMSDAVAVLRCERPYTAFVFQHPLMIQAFQEYITALQKRHATERAETVRMLEEYSEKLRAD